MEHQDVRSRRSRFPSRCALNLLVCADSVMISRFSAAVKAGADEGRCRVHFSTDALVRCSCRRVLNSLPCE
ncbi:hypothetical protein AVEN_100669-1 [Araneus ventricosus]|uniref:Uncharacterized protein n=1 Tax=Araneus ventricosus TaxID=182803 RepID=A0A4Y2W5V0_ARAVE|nr:hypothetical protein AVEN_100669-1 [Araneus ventricosus]